MFEREVSLEELEKLLSEAPVTADINPVSLCFLDDVRITSLDKLFTEVDSLKPSIPLKTLIIDSKGDEKFIKVRVNHDPFTPELNKIIFDKFDEISEKMFKQSEIAKKIESEANTDVVILFIVDGLSYWDVKRCPPDLGFVRPCLVDAPTLTHVAFPNIIGNPPIAQRLFDKGYRHRIGFSYWTREDNVLTDCIFKTFPSVNKISDFLEIVKILKAELKSNIFVQIVREGFDEFAHKQKRLLPMDAVINDIYREFRQLINLCESLQLSYSLYLTSDHGILWRSDFTPDIIGDCTKCSPRYYRMGEPNKTGKLFIVNGEEFYCLAYPKLRRPLRIDEQGVHGGISFQESIVPFVEVVKNDD